MHEHIEQYNYKVTIKGMSILGETTTTYKYYNMSKSLEESTKKLLQEFGDVEIVKYELCFIE